MIQTILVDDEKHSLEALRLELEINCPQVKITGMYQDPEQALTRLLSDPPDLLLLDIQMPAMTGFDLLKAIQDISFYVIFVTAYDQYAMQAIKVSAMDYIMKPIDGLELIKAIKKVEKNRQLKQTQLQVDFLLTNLEMNASIMGSKIALPTVKGIDFVTVSEIHYCMAESNYTIIHTINGEKYVLSRTLRDFESMLQSKSFFRTHKSYLVNLNYIKQYEKGGGGVLILKDDTRIYVARSKKEELLKLIYGK